MPFSEGVYAAFTTYACVLINFGGITDQSITVMSISLSPYNKTDLSCLHIATFVKLPHKSSAE